MFAIFKRFGDIRGQQRELGIAIQLSAAALHRGLQRFMVDARLKVGAQAGFCYFLFLRGHPFNHKRLAQIARGQTGLIGRHALLGGENKPTRFLFATFISHGHQLLKDSRQYRRLAKLLRQCHDLVQFAVIPRHAQQ